MPLALALALALTPRLAHTLALALALPPCNLHSIPHPAYKVCYKLSTAAAYVALEGTLRVHARAPTRYTDDGHVVALLEGGEALALSLTLAVSKSQTPSRNPIPGSDTLNLTLGLGLTQPYP